jgi:hypothetical protein
MGLGQSDNICKFSRLEGLGVPACQGRGRLRGLGRRRLTGPGRYGAVQTDSTCGPRVGDIFRPWQCLNPRKSKIKVCPVSPSHIKLHCVARGLLSKFHTCISRASSLRAPLAFTETMLRLSSTRVWNAARSVSRPYNVSAINQPNQAFSSSAEQGPGVLEP